MVGSKDHTKISTTNIIKPAMEALPADDQRPFEDLVTCDEEVMRQWNEQHDKEAELLHKLSERRKEAAEKYLSHFMVDRH
jgi:aldehyde:ferredoxin oxidoreductase